MSSQLISSKYVNLYAANTALGSLIEHKGIHNFGRPQHSEIDGFLVVP